jgi:class 3 adenylate cyclase
MSRTALAALDIIAGVSHVNVPASSPTSSPASSPIQVRIGLHCGPIFAGVIGKDRLQYDIWGDTVNVASRLESTGEAGRIHVSEAFADAFKTSPPATSSQFPVPSSLIERGTIELKGKGTMTTYWLDPA